MLEVNCHIDKQITCDKEQWCLKATHELFFSDKIMCGTHMNEGFTIRYSNCCQTFSCYLVDHREWTSQCLDTPLCSEDHVWLWFPVGTQYCITTCTISWIMQMRADITLYLWLHQFLLLYSYNRGWDLLMVDCSESLTAVWQGSVFGNHWRLQDFL